VEYALKERKKRKGLGGPVPSRCTINGQCRLPITVLLYENLYSPEMVAIKIKK